MRFIIISFFILLSASLISQNQLFTEIQREDLNSDQSMRLADLENATDYQNFRIISIGKLGRNYRNGRINIKIPGIDRPLVAFPSKIETHREMRYLWVGKFENKPFSEIVISYCDGFIRGHIDYDGKYFNILGLGADKAVIASNNSTNLRSCGSTEQVEENNNPNVNSIARSSCDETRVLFVFEEGFGGLISKATYFTNGANQTMSNSNIDMWLNLVGAIESPYDDFNTVNAAANFMTGGGYSYFLSNAQSYMADIVVFVINANDLVKGQANLGPVSSDFNQIVINYFGADDITFAHEVGHVFGGRHHSCSVNPGSCTPSSGTPTYARAHEFDANNKTRRTAIFGGHPANRIKHYSDPDVDYFNKPTGVTNSADNGRIIGINKCAVANLYPPPFTASITGPTSGTSFPYYTWSASVNNCPGTTYNWERSYDGYNYYYLGNSTSVTRQLLNNDLYLRLTITCSDGQSGTFFHFCENTDLLFRTSNDSEFFVFPNPTSQSINMKINAKITEDVIISVSDALGNHHYLNEVKVYKGPNRIQADVSDYIPGIYVVTLHMQNKKINRRIYIN